MNNPIRLPAVWLAFMLSSAATLSIAADQNFTAQERISCHRALEEVRWSYRIWPEVNPDSKPPLSAVMGDDALQRKAGDSVRMSAVLDARYGKRLDADRLQAEINRMASRTRNPERLRELFATLDDDPLLIAECLARPGLAQRELYQAYTRDDRVHGKQRAKLKRRLAGKSDLAQLAGAETTTTVYVRSSGQAASASDEPKTPGEIALTDREWNELQAELGLEPASRRDELRLEESDTTFYVRQVASLTDDRMVIEAITWPKRDFDDWWREVRSEFNGAQAVDPAGIEVPEIAGQSAQARAAEDDQWYTPYRSPRGREAHTAIWTGSEMIIWGGEEFGRHNTGGRYSPVTDSWTPVSLTDAPANRKYHSAVWTGSEMIVWGGTSSIRVDDTGGRYDPSTDTWTVTSTNGTPSPRSKHTAIWTGSAMVVWGGDDYLDVPFTSPDIGHMNTGGRYDPETDSWTATSITNAPVARSWHIAVWTGSEMIVWGGRDSDGVMNTGGHYDPDTDTWTATGTTNVPTPRSSHAATWTGSEMIVWGGYDSSDSSHIDTGGRYDPVTGIWTATSTTDVPAARSLHTVVWTDSEMLVWGGGDSDGAMNTGGRYDPGTDTWTAMGSSNTPAARKRHTAVWTGSEMIVWGGENSDRIPLNTGGRYEPGTDAWTTTYKATPDGRRSHTAVWTGSEMIVWGGAYLESSVTPEMMNSGGRYDPVTDSWTPTSTTNVPAARARHSAVWTGSEMIVWGGRDASTQLGSGGRYDPATDSWTSTTDSGAPSARDEHTAVWIGTEMIVWGGFDGNDGVNTGGIYDPATDAWTSTTTASAPSARDGHTVVWTGSEMIVWGGNGNTGGRYDPETDTWAPTTTDNVPAGRANHTAIWTGSEMIVWGGGSTTGYDTGGRYDPSTDSWAATSTTDVPAARHHHTAVWTGGEMIVWGGFGDFDELNSGGRYDPATDAWTATTITAAPDTRKRHTAIWTGDAMIVSLGCCAVSRYSHFDYGIYTMGDDAPQGLVFRDRFEE